MVPRREAGSRPDFWNVASRSDRTTITGMKTCPIWWIPCSVVSSLSPDPSVLGYMGPLESELLLRLNTMYPSSTCCMWFRSRQWLLASPSINHMTTRRSSASEKVIVSNSKVANPRSCTNETGIVVSAAVCILTAIFVAFVVTTSPIDPIPLVLPRRTFSWVRENRKLECVEKLGEGLVLGPEDVVVARDGSLVVSTRDGWVKKVWPRNGTVENWKHVGGYPCGLALGVHGEILVADPVQGLLNVTDDDNEVRYVTRMAEGTPITFADSVTVSGRGQVYFTDASTKHLLHFWYLDVLESRPYGRVLNFDPTTGRTTVLMKGLGFANGIALSPAEDFLVVCESWKYRCVRYWLEGECKGKLETFIDNLPGFPDNIHLHAPSQTFWLGLVGGRSWLTDLTHKTVLLKHFFARFWHRVKPFNFERGELIAINLDGEVQASYQDPRGARFSFVTGAVIQDNYLYIGSLTETFLGRLNLCSQDCSLPL